MENGADYRRVWFPNWPVHVTEDNRTFVLPIDMRFNEGHRVSLIFYSILMVLSSIGNISVLTILLQIVKNSRSRINMMLIHLAIADLLVTFTLMPMEIVWAATVSWWFGDVACRIAAFFRTFGLYLSSFVLVSIGLDRYYAVLKPMKLSVANRRGKLIITCAWITSALCSSPQTVFYHVETHPNVSWYEQCITFNSFPTPEYELAYALYGMLSLYILPLCFITYFYGSIVIELCKRSRDAKDHLNTDKLRRNNPTFYGKARIRTLKMTVTIILAFFICWFPYYFMTVWYLIDKDSASKVDIRTQKALFFFACTNSGINPIVYGVFNIRRQINVSRTRGSNTCSTEVRMQQVGQINRNMNESKQ